MSKGRNVQNVKFSVKLPGDEERKTQGFTLVDSRSRNVAILVHHGEPLSRQEAKGEKKATAKHISIFEVLPRDDIKKVTKKGAAPIYLRTLSEVKSDGRVVHRAINTAVSKLIYGNSIPDDADSKKLKFINFAGEETEIPLYDEAVREVISERAAKQKPRKKKAEGATKKKKRKATVEEEEDEDSDLDDPDAAIKKLQAQIRLAKAAKRKKAKKAKTVEPEPMEEEEEEEEEEDDEGEDEVSPSSSMSE